MSIATGMTMDAVLIILITFIAAFFAALAQYFFKGALPKFSFNMKEMLSLFRNKGIVTGIIVYFIGLGFYLYALRSGELSFVYPVFSIIFVFVALIGMIKFKERLGIKRIAGLALIIIGIVVIALT